MAEPKAKAKPRARRKKVPTPPPPPPPPWDPQDPALGIWSDKRGNWFHVAGTVWTTTSWAIAEAQLRVIGGGDDWRIRRVVDWLSERG